VLSFFDLSKASVKRNVVTTLKVLANEERSAKHPRIAEKRAGERWRQTGVVIRSA
jgi:hypothetical protein